MLIQEYNMKKVLISLVLAASLTVPSAFAKEANSQKQADTAVQFRQAVLQLVRSNMGPLGAMAKGQIEYDAEVMNKNALRIEQLATMMDDYFALDTRKFEVKTEASDKIWEEMEDFSSKSHDMINAAANLQKVATAKDVDNYRKAIGDLGATCKACHDKFKID
ncbi:MAG: cytochrome c556 [Glaciecola sp.]|jgi:cytochrome c556|mmetsp:Transcript_55260/g.175764  ORF Transcript_55260/g.175764 Transcript_55260/m.175764 type:complete len:163 (-) Transcript_55260:67-555(-)